MSQVIHSVVKKYITTFPSLVICFFFLPQSAIVSKLMILQVVVYEEKQDSWEAVSLCVEMKIFEKRRKKYIKWKSEDANQLNDYY